MRFERMLFPYSFSMKSSTMKSFLRFSCRWFMQTKWCYINWNRRNTILHFFFVFPAIFQTGLSIWVHLILRLFSDIFGFSWIDLLPYKYKWPRPLEGSIQLHQSIYEFNFHYVFSFALLFLTLGCCSSLDPMTNGGILGLEANLVQPCRRHPRPHRDPSRLRVSMDTLLVCHKLVFLSHTSTIVILYWFVTLHHEIMIVMSPEPVFKDHPDKNQNTKRSVV
jgi:hypothetical protein